MCDETIEFPTLCWDEGERRRNRKEEEDKKERSEFNLIVSSSARATKTIGELPEYVRAREERRCLRRSRVYTSYENREHTSTYVYTTTTKSRKLRIVFCLFG